MILTAGFAAAADFSAASEPSLAAVIDADQLELQAEPAGGVQRALDEDGDVLFFVEDRSNDGQVKRGLRRSADRSPAPVG